MQFAPTAEEEAKKINAQTGASYVTDPRFWAKQGIFTGEELALSILNQTYSDIYKSIHNVRPRTDAFTSVAQASAAIDKLDKYVEMMAAQERLEIEQQEEYERERKELEDLMPGDFDYEELPMQSGMRRRMENKTLKPNKAISSSTKVKKISSKQLKDLILSEARAMSLESTSAVENKNRIEHSVLHENKNDAQIIARWCKLAGIITG